MKRSQVEAKKLDVILGNLKAEAMLALLTDTLAEVENETLGDLKAEELLVEFAATVAKRKVKTFCNTIGEEELKTMFYTLAPHTSKGGA